MSNKLKPCPWPSCGSDNVKLPKHLQIHRVWCLSCGAEGPGANSEEEATRLWNERAGDGAQPEIEYTTISADGSKIFVFENGEVKEYSLGEDYRRLFGEEGSTDEV